MRFPTCCLQLAAIAAGVITVPAQLPAQSASTAVLNGQVFVNQGLVGVGRLPSAACDKFGETIGSFSALTHDAKSWRRNADGTYAGTFYMQPDRGYNNPGTTNWRARFFTLAITFNPSLFGATTQNQVGISVADTTLLTEADGTPFTALDTAAGAAGVRAGVGDVARTAPSVQRSPLDRCRGHRAPARRLLLHQRRIRSLHLQVRRRRQTPVRHPSA